MFAPRSLRCLADLRRVHHVPLASHLLNTSRGAPSATRFRTLSHFAISALGQDPSASSLLLQQPLFPRQQTGWQFDPSSGPSLHTHGHTHGRRKNGSLAAAAAVGPLRSFRMSSAVLTRTSRGLRTVRTGYVYQPPT